MSERKLLTSQIREFELEKNELTVQCDTLIDIWYEGTCPRNKKLYKSLSKMNKKKVVYDMSVFLLLSRSRLLLAGARNASSWREQNGLEFKKNES